MHNKQSLTRALVAVFVGFGLTVASAYSQDPPAPRPSTAQAGAQQSMPGTSTLTGCVYREQDVPGRTPNVAERAGVLEDYILADVKPAAQQSQAGAPATATGTSGTTNAMYKLEGIADERLKAVVGKRVEVTGRIDAEPGDTTGAKSATKPPADRSVGPDRIELPEFEISSIREVSGTCPPKPQAK
jgi:hypothetical protein